MSDTTIVITAALTPKEVDVLAQCLSHVPPTEAGGTLRAKLEGMITVATEAAGEFSVAVKRPT